MTLKQALWEIVRDENIIITNQNIDWLLDRAEKRANDNTDKNKLKGSILERKEKLDEKFPINQNKSNNPIVEFVSYDGYYPCLCTGTLVLRIDGKIVELKGCLVSGGGLSEDYSDAYQDEWSINFLPEELEPLKDIITDLVNENVEFGCCGGCI